MKRQAKKTGIGSNTVTTDTPERAKWDVKINTFFSLLEGLLHGDQDDHEAQDLRQGAKATMVFPPSLQSEDEWKCVCLFLNTRKDFMMQSNANLKFSLFFFIILLFGTIPNAEEVEYLHRQLLFKARAE